jgi:sugar lactone lactonase YvrE
MYFVDTPTLRVDVLGFDADAGVPTSRRPLADLSSFGGIPDGLAVDVDGCPWVVMHDGAAIVRVAPDGRLLRTLEVPVAKPTSCCFAGPALDRLAVTSARGVDGAGGDLFVCDVGVGCRRCRSRMTGYAATRSRFSNADAYRATMVSAAKHERVNGVEPVHDRLAAGV